MLVLFEIAGFGGHFEAGLRPHVLHLVRKGRQHIGPLPRTLGKLVEKIDGFAKIAVEQGKQFVSSLFHVDVPHFWFSYSLSLMVRGCSGCVGRKDAAFCMARMRSSSAWAQ
jgi:hypothetical protein